MPRAFRKEAAKQRPQKPLEHMRYPAALHKLHDGAPQADAAGDADAELHGLLRAGEGGAAVRSARRGHKKRGEYK